MISNPGRAAVVETKCGRRTEEPDITPSKVEKRTRSRNRLPRSREMRELSRELASLAFTRVKQGGQLLVRQREQLRRALAAVGTNLDWAATAAPDRDSVDEISKDVLRIARNGARSLVRELDTLRAAKKAEMAQLESVAAVARELAVDPDAAYPVEITYSHTARDGSAGLVTKTEMRTVNDAEEALGVAETIEGRMDRWEALRDQMTDELEEKQRELGVMQSTLSDFVKSQQPLLREVLVTLHWVV